MWTGESTAYFLKWGGGGGGGHVIKGDPNQSLRDITGEIPCLAMLSRVSGFLVETGSDHTERISGHIPDVVI